MDTETIKIPLFTGNIASKVLSAINLRMFDAIVVADSNWVTVDYID
jgi:hypothetical protein